MDTDTIQFIQYIIPVVSVMVLIGITINTWGKWLKLDSVKAIALWVITTIVFMIGWIRIIT